MKSRSTNDVYEITEEITTISQNPQLSNPVAPIYPQTISPAISPAGTGVTASAIPPTYPPLPPRNSVYPYPQSIPPTRPPNQVQFNAPPMTSAYNYAISPAHVTQSYHTVSKPFLCYA